MVLNGIGILEGRFLEQLPMSHSHGVFNEGLSMNKGVEVLDHENT
jgi:hypothetical protein